MRSVFRTNVNEVTLPCILGHVLHMYLIRARIHVASHIQRSIALEYIFNRKSISNSLQTNRYKYRFLVSVLLQIELLVYSGANTFVMMETSNQALALNTIYFHVYLSKLIFLAHLGLLLVFENPTTR